MRILFNSSWYLYIGVVLKGESRFSPALFFKLELTDTTTTKQIKQPGPGFSRHPPGAVGEFFLAIWQKFTVIGMGLQTLSVIFSAVNDWCRRLYSPPWNKNIFLNFLLIIPLIHTISFWLRLLIFLLTIPALIQLSQNFFSLFTLKLFASNRCLFFQKIFHKFSFGLYKRYSLLRVLPSFQSITNLKAGLISACQSKSLFCSKYKNFLFSLQKTLANKKNLA